MPTVRLMLEARNALGDERSGSTNFAISMDGQTVGPVSAADAERGFALQSGSRIRVEAKASGLHPVVQELAVDDDKVRFVGVREPHAQLLQHGIVEGESRYDLVAWMTLFRRRSVADLGWSEGVGSYGVDIMDLAGEFVLSSSGRGNARLNHVSIRSVTQHDSTLGALEFFETSKTAKEPQLVALYVPAGLRHDKPIPISTFCLPTLKTKPNYPRHAYYHGRIDWYLGLSYHLLHQNALRKKVCLAFPMPHPHPVYFGGIQSAARLRRYLQELVFELHAHGHVGAPLPQLGRCAISGFSRGGSMVGSVVRTSLREHAPDKRSTNEFPELKEAWSLDGEPASVRLVNQHASTWLSAVPDRRLRLYIAEYEELAKARPSFASGLPRQSGAAHEWATDKPRGSTRPRSSGCSFMRRRWPPAERPTWGAPR